MASALTGGFHLAYLVGAGITVVAMIVAVVVLEPVKAMAHGEMPEAVGDAAALGEAGEAPAAPAYAEA
jgi:hypothetical protein